jgi:hypothetical protein
MPLSKFITNAEEIEKISYVLGSGGPLACLKKAISTFGFKTFALAIRFAYWGLVRFKNDLYLRRRLALFLGKA